LSTFLCIDLTSNC